MYVGRRIHLWIMWRFGWHYVLFYIVLASLICYLYEYQDFTFLAIPFLPVSLVGTAVAFYVGFKNNSSYERLWEGRRIWGSIVNTSRTWGIMVLDYINPRTSDLQQQNIDWKKIHTTLLYRNLAFANALRFQLRRRTIWELYNVNIHKNHQLANTLIQEKDSFQQGDFIEILRPYLSQEELDYVLSCQNPATQIVRLQSQHLKELNTNGLLEDFRYFELEKLLVELYNQQGASERIKTFPLPRQYAFFSSMFVWLFVLLLPFGLVGEFAKMGENMIWLVIPAYLLVAWVFMTMELVGDASENPFDNAINDVPLTAICRTIEIDLREMLRETEIPPKIQPIDHILM